MPPLSLVSIQYHQSSVQSVPQCHSRMKSSKAVKCEWPEGTVKTVHLSASLQLHEDLCFRWPCLRPPRPCDLSRSSPVCCCPFSPPFGSNRCDQRILAIMIHDAASIRSTTGTIGSVRNQRRINTVATGQVNGRRMIGYLEEKSWVMGVKAVVPDRARARAVL
jgi:hypothetical protein